MDADELAFWYWLTDVKGIGPVMTKKLIDQFADPYQVYSTTAEVIVERTGIRASLAGNIEAAKHGIERYIQLAKRQVEIADRLGGRILTRNDGSYGEIYSQYVGEEALPALVHVLGNEDCLRARRIAIVGTRRPSSEGEKRAHDLGRALGAEGIAVVSGLAIGIDTAAHTGALDAGGKTVAIMGCGADVRYPPGNGGVYSRIVKEGLVLSEFPFGVRPSSENLRKRNRTIAAFSEGVVVAECPIRSGAMIAARFAAQQKKPLFSFKYSDTVDNSGGDWLVSRHLASELVDASVGALEDAFNQYVEPPDMKVDKVFQEIWPKHKKPAGGKTEKKRAGQETVSKRKDKLASIEGAQEGGVQKGLPFTEDAEDLSQNKEAGSFEFKEGDKVIHPKFGEGEILKVMELKSDYEITIRFSPKKIHTFLWKYANLTRA